MELKIFIVDFQKKNLATSVGKSSFKKKFVLKNFLYFFLARRPPVEETTSFLNSLLASHGPNYLEKLFGPKARHRLRELGGVNTVAIALSGIIYIFSFE